MKLKNNSELRQYLILLSDAMRKRGSADIADSLRAASDLASTWPPTEFYGEARIVLRKVAAEVLSLSQSEVKDLREVLAQLDSTFARR